MLDRHLKWQDKVSFAFKTVCEALQRLLMEKFIEEVNAEEQNPESLINLVQNCSREKLDLVIKDDLANALLQKYMDFEKRLGKVILERLQLFS